MLVIDNTLGGLPIFKGGKMERKMMSISSVQTRFSLSDKKLGKSLAVMRKRHDKDEWMIKKETNYLKLEGVAWIEKVYLRENKEYYLDAEIKFTLYHIERLTKELNIPKENLYPTAPMTIHQLMALFKKSKASLMKAMKSMCRCNIQYKSIINNKAYISVDGCKWLITNYYKQYHFELLNQYKRELQKRKEYLWRRNAEKK